jgi:siderophore synthetase component
MTRPTTGPMSGPMTPPVNPGALTCQALLNCLVREVSGPERQAWQAGGHLVIRLPRTGPVLRAALRRGTAGPGPRLAGEVEIRHEESWRAIGWQHLASLIAAELTLATGLPNEEFTAQVQGSHAAITAIVQARGTAADGTAGAPPGPLEKPPGLTGDRHVDQYLASEQALVAGHRFHPAPKARQGGPRDWLRYAPEAGARFPLRFLGVREDVLAAEGDTGGLDRLGGPVPPPGYRLLPAHPWQLGLLERQPWLEPARKAGLLLDLGPGGQEVIPTSSVRTVYDPAADVFCKFSLNVRITNCLRISAWYELAGSVVLSGLLAPVWAELAGLFPGTVLLAEPGYRTAALASRSAFEGLAVIAREGLRGRVRPEVTPLLAAALAEPSGQGGTLFGGRDPDWLAGWWDAYVRRVAPPVLHVLFAHGIVLEPHLQNVLAGVDADGLPAQAIFRDLEGVKLVSSRHAARLAALPPGVARALAYDREHGWNRVAYCLFVNHLAEVAAAVADGCPGQAERLEAALWSRARRVLAEFARDHGWTPELRALLAGVPLPAKANLRVRWARAADREAAYVQVPNPLSEPAPL